jgi:hypothetical protein
MSAVSASRAADVYGQIAIGAVYEFDIAARIRVYPRTVSARVPSSTFAGAGGFFSSVISRTLVVVELVILRHAFWRIFGIVVWHLGEVSNTKSADGISGVIWIMFSSIPVEPIFVLCVLDPRLVLRRFDFSAYFSVSGG